MSQYTVDQTASGTGIVETITGNSGGAVPPTAGNITLIGSGGITVVGDPGTSTLTISVSGTGTPWTSVAGTTQAMAVNNGYVPQNVALTTFTLPVTSVFGSYLAIVGNGSGGWIIAQNAGQNIQIGANSSTIGVGGSVASVNRYDSLELICTVANTTWVTLGGPQSAGLTIV